MFISEKCWLVNGSVLFYKINTSNVALWFVHLWSNRFWGHVHQASRVFLFNVILQLNIQYINIPPVQFTLTVYAGVILGADTLPAPVFIPWCPISSITENFSIYKTTSGTRDLKEDS